MMNRNIIVSVLLSVLFSLTAGTQAFAKGKRTCAYSFFLLEAFLTA